MNFLLNKMNKEELKLEAIKGLNREKLILSNQLSRLEIYDTKERYTTRLREIDKEIRELVK